MGRIISKQKLITKEINRVGLKNKRNESKAEFVNTANKIYIETVQFLTKLSNRYSRLIASDIMKLDSEVLDESEKGK